jgi:hypothetical protein
MFRKVRFYRLLLSAAVLASGCASLPAPAEYRATAAVLAQPGQAPAIDARARFRNIFCALAHRQGAADVEDPECESLLWRLGDEPDGSAPGAALPALSPRLHVFVVGGAFSDCFGESASAYGRAIESVRQRGIRAHSVPISGRSGTERNAAIIAETLSAENPGLDDLVVLIGYSKGTVDILQFLVDYPVMVRFVDAVVGVSGPVRGSRLAEQSRWFYDTFLERAFAGRCDPGDGQVLESLLPARRIAWLNGHQLPASVDYFTLSAFTTREHMANGLTSSYAMLAKESRRNDGQVTLESSLIPGSVLLGYANTDHWGLAIDIEEELEWMGSRKNPQPYPRQLLFESILRFVAEALDAGSNAQSGWPITGSALAAHGRPVQNCGLER